jgi:hypothetical protein
MRFLVTKNHSKNTPCNRRLTNFKARVVVMLRLILLVSGQQNLEQTPEEDYHEQDQTISQKHQPVQ